MLVESYKYLKMGYTSTCFNNYSFISVTLYVDESKEKFKVLLLLVQRETNNTAHCGVVHSSLRLFPIKIKEKLVISL